MLEIINFQLSTYREKDVHLLLIVFDFAAGIAWLRYQGPRFYDTTLTIVSRKNDLRVEALKTKREAAKAGNSDLIGL